MGFPRLYVVHVQPDTLLRPPAACHARLVTVFEQDLVADPGPLVRIQKLPASRMR